MPAPIWVAPLLPREPPLRPHSLLAFYSGDVADRIMNEKAQRRLSGQDTSEGRPLRAALAERRGMELVGFCRLERGPYLAVGHVALVGFSKAQRARVVLALPLHGPQRG